VQHRAKIFPSAVIEIRENEDVKQSLILLEEELRRRYATLISMRAVTAENKNANVTLPALVVVFDRVSDVYNHAAFSLILKNGRELGVYGIFLMDKVEDLPSECGAYVTITSEDVSYNVTGYEQESVHDINPDTVRHDLIQAFANKISSINWLIPEQVTEPPDSLSLLDLFPLIELNDLPLERWWGGEYPFGYLRAPIGKFSPTAELVFDLNDSDTGHGPHGLIGGMTGSGKSELLKTLILSLAMTHHPYDLNFALIDYKGGGAFSEFYSLPHVVGVVTDIQSHADYATRVIQALSWEVKNREKILGDALTEFGLTIAHVDEYRKKMKVRIPLPRLVIVFDEFAEFQERHPEESKKMINIARVGRSLGIHLVLCTQNPMGRAVDQQVRDNSNFTICLKVKTPDTSKALINIPDAILLRRGQAYFHVDAPQKFKVAYTGKDYLYSGKQQIKNTTLSISRNYLTKTVSESQAIIEEISSQSVKLGIPELPKIWPDPLPEQLSLNRLFEKLGNKTSWNGTTWTSENHHPPEIPLGLLDDPSHQQQPVFCVRDHLLIFGPSGSGKSTALLTFAMAIGKLYSPAEAHIYCIDISGQSPLTILSNRDMPHLPCEGGVILGSDIERTSRLFKMLGEEISRRFNAHLNNPRRNTDPYIFVLVDGISQQFNSNNPGFTEQLDFIMKFGSDSGVFVVLAGNLPNDIPVKLQDDRSAILFQSTERGTILSIVKRVPETYQKKMDVGQDPKPGRGVINTNPSLEFQCALPIDIDLESHNLGKIGIEFDLMSRSWKGKRPPSVEILPTLISISEIGTKDSLEDAVIGKNQETLDPVGLSLVKDGPLFMILSMAAGLGKTSTLHVLISQLCENYQPQDLKLILIDYHTRTLRHFSKSKYLLFEDNISGHVKNKDDLSNVISWIKEDIKKRKNLLSKAYSDSPETFDDLEMVKSLGYILVVIDDYEVFSNSSPSEIETLASILKSGGGDVGLRLVVAEDFALLGNDDLAKLAKKYGSGILLGGSDGLSVFNNATPPFKQKTFNLPPGRGYIIKQGKAQLIQTAYMNK
jgi:S-DNA-T family DNA segregation ATPase FtsK/SpoIIIE